MYLHVLGIVHGNIAPVSKLNEWAIAHIDTRRPPEQYFDYSGWPGMPWRIWDHRIIPTFQGQGLRINNSSVHGPRMFFVGRLERGTQQTFPRE